MKMQKKQMSAAIALALTLTIAATFITSVPVAYAPGGNQLQGVFQTHIYVSASPNPVGKGQNVFFAGWVWPAPSNAILAYHDLTFTFTKPDGTKFNVTKDSHLAGTVELNYVPDQVGNWSVVLSFRGEYGDRLPGVSPPYKFTVTEEPIPIPDWTALPTGPWTYPVSQVNQEWFRITGAWPVAAGDWGGQLTNDYTTGPETAHILWKMPMVEGGLLGGDQGHVGITKPTGDVGGIVAAHGKLYFTRNAGSGSSEAPTVYCIDQYTGKQLWATPLPIVNSTTGQVVAAARTGGTTLQLVACGMEQALLSAGYMRERENVLSSYYVFQLWVSGGGLWNIDPLTGRILWYQLQPALSPVYHQGAWYINNYPVAGNFSCVAIYPGRSSGVSFPPEPLTSTVPRQATSLIWTKNVSQTGITMTAISEGYIIQNLYNTSTGMRKLITWDAKTGDLVANGTYAQSYESDGQNPVYGQGVFSALGEDGKTYAWSFKTGSLLWVSEPMDWPYGTWGAYTGAAGLGLIISDSYDGHKYAYNATTGKLVWKQYTGTDNPYNFEYANNAPCSGFGATVSADNKVYWASGEHTVSVPIQRGYMLYCNEAATGELLWKLVYFNSRASGQCGISSGMLWFKNDYDGCLYMFGKGETETTVSASPKTVANGGIVLIEGTVTDESPISEPGTPAVSDEGMSDWMAYLYTLGTTGPLVNLTNVKGVTVFLQAMRSDGTVIDITHVTTDIMGHYEYTWTPPDQDTYKVLATFEGSESYYTSSAQTGLSVGAAPPATQAPEAAPDNTPTIIGTGIAIIIAVAIVGMLLYRKRP